MPPKLPLPRGWRRRVRSSVLHILALSLCLPKTIGRTRLVFPGPALRGFGVT